MNNRSPISSAPPIQGPVLQDTTPNQQVPQTTPRVPNYADERDSLHVATNLATMRETLGELTASITSLSTNAADLRNEVRGIDSRVNELKTEQVSTSKTIKVVSYIATPMIGLVAALIAWFAPLYWSAAMRPDMEKTIAASVKADLEKEQAAREKSLAQERRIAELEAQLKASKK